MFYKTTIIPADDPKLAERLLNTQAPASTPMMPWQGRIPDWMTLGWAHQDHESVPWAVLEAE